MDNLGILILLACGTLASSQATNNTTIFFCYRCNPTLYGASACADPARYNVPLVNCTSQVSGNISNWRFNCYSAYLDYRNVSGNGINQNNRTGIHRDCSVYPATTVDPACSYNSTSNITVVSCITCAISGCNTHIFNTGGIISGGGGVTPIFPGGGGNGNRPGAASAMVPSIFLILFCGFFMFYKS